MSLTYVFAIQGADGPPPGGCAGHPGGSDLYQVVLGDAGGLRVVAQDVPTANFSEQALRGRLADPADLEALARTHHAVVTAVAAAGPVIPLPFATLFTDRARAAQSLVDRAAQFHALLDRLRDRAEWAVKVYAKQVGAQRSEAAVAQPARSSVPAPGAGRAYLDRVRTRRQAQQARQEAALAEAARVDEAIKALADGAVRRRPHSAQVTGRDRPQLLNGAYLVDLGRTEQFHAVVDALRADAVAVEIEASGPWVPYSFAETGAGS